MFKSLRDEILKLNADVKDVANCERAKNLRNKLLKIGIPLAVVGIIGVFTCFALFTIAGMGGADMALVPFLLFLPCGAVAGVGMTITSLGLKIVITGYVAELVDDTVGNNCPNCNTPLADEAEFCHKCGTACVKKCPHCNTINSKDSEFCKKCGEKL